MKRYLDVSSRIAKKMRELNLKQVDLIKGTGASKGTVNQWVSGVSIPSNRYDRKLASILDTSVDWLIHGLEEKSELEAKDQNAEYIGHIDAWDSNTVVDEDEIEVPYYMDVELAAGYGGELANEIKGPKLRFSKSTFRNCGVQPEAAACVKVSGNSMEPRLYDGDVVGVDTMDKRIVDGKTYAINHDGLLRVKRLYRLPGGGIRINSMNTAEYPDEHYDAEEAKYIVVIGRVFWHSSIW